MNLRSKMLLLKRWKRIKLFVEKLGSFRSNLWTNNGKQEENKCWFSTILMGSSIKKVVFDENRWSKFYTNLKCQFVLFNSLCPRQMYLKCQYELPLSWHITEDLQPLSPPWLRTYFRESLLETVQVVIRSEKTIVFRHTTINYYAHNTISPGDRGCFSESPC